MSEVNPIKAVENYGDRLKSLNLSQFSEAENVNKLLAIFAEVFEELEQDWQDLSESFLLENAEGAQLDILGEEVGIVRPSDDDNEYRVRILLFSAARFFGITRDELVDLIKMVSGDVNPFFYRGAGRFFEVTIQSACADSQQLGRDLIQYFPLNTEVLVLTKDGTPFGFEGDSRSAGFGTTAGLAQGSGGFATVVYPI